MDGSDDAEMGNENGCGRSLGNWQFSRRIGARQGAWFFNLLGLKWFLVFFSFFYVIVFNFIQPIRDMSTSSRGGGADMKF